MTASPERVLGAMQSPRQAAPREELQRLTSVIEGYADHVLDRVGRRLIPTFDQIHEAMQRHRVERGEAERFIEGLLGLKLERAHYERGQAFCRRRRRARRPRRAQPPVGERVDAAHPERARRARPLARPHRPSRRHD